MNKLINTPTPNAETGTISVLVVCALADRAKEIRLEVSTTTNIREAVRLAKIADDFPELDIEQLSLGIYGRLVAREDEPHTLLRADDRIEIYRPLIRDARHLLHS